MFRLKCVASTRLTTKIKKKNHFCMGFRSQNPKLNFVIYIYILYNVKVYTNSGIKPYIHVASPATVLPTNFSLLLSLRKLSKFEIAAACSSSSHTDYISSKLKV
jgi:hypothetical protein